MKLISPVLPLLALWLLAGCASPKRLPPVADMPPPPDPRRGHGHHGLVEWADLLAGDAATIQALLRTVTDKFARYAKVKKNIPEEAMAAVGDATEPEKLADLVAGHLGFDVEQTQTNS